MESFAASLLGAVSAERDDPVGILFPAAAMLLLQVVAVWIVRSAVGVLEIRTLIAMTIGLHILAGIVAVPFRALLLGAGARVADRPVHALLRAPSLLGVHLVITALQLMALGVVAAGTWLVSSFLVTRGWYGFGTLALGIGACVGSGALLVVRALLAYAPVRAVVGGETPWRALRKGPPHGLRDGATVFGLLAVGDILVAVGGVACGAGALPGYPIGDLAVLHRWVHAEDT